MSSSVSYCSRKLLKTAFGNKFAADSFSVADTVTYVGNLSIYAENYKIYMQKPGLIPELQSGILKPVHERKHVQLFHTEYSYNLLTA